MVEIGREVGLFGWEAEIGIWSKSHDKHGHLKVVAQDRVQVTFEHLSVSTIISKKKLMLHSKSFPSFKNGENGCTSATLFWAPQRTSLTP